VCVCVNECSNRRRSERETVHYKYTRREDFVVHTCYYRPINPIRLSLPVLNPFHTHTLLPTATFPTVRRIRPSDCLPKLPKIKRLRAQCVYITFETDLNYSTFNHTNLPRVRVQRIMCVCACSARQMARETV